MQWLPYFWDTLHELCIYLLKTYNLHTTLFSLYNFIFHSKFKIFFQGQIFKPPYKDTIKDVHVICNWHIWYIWRVCSEIKVNWKVAWLDECHLQTKLISLRTIMFMLNLVQESCRIMQNLAYSETPIDILWLFKCKLWSLIIYEKGTRNSRQNQIK